MAHRYYITIILSFLAAIATAQTNETFEEFRQNMLSDYNSYRGQILDDYAKFLDTAWKNYETFRGESQFTSPKPKKTPSAPKVDGTPVSIIPTPEKPSRPTPAPSIPDITPDIPSPILENLTFPFYSNTITAPRLYLPELESVDEKSISEIWKEYQSKNIYGKVSSSLHQLRIAYNLNDWLTYELVRTYCDAVYPHNVKSSLVLSHYLLVNMGYNVRLGRSDEGQIILLIPFKQNVYERSFLTLDGIKYYIFTGKWGRTLDEKIKSLYTCDLPKNANLGKKFNLVIDNPNITSEKNISFNLSDGKMTLTGTVPYSAILIANDYLETDVPVYAASTLSSTFRNDILKQVSSQISGLNEYDAVNKILHFIQYAFKYKTDGEQFGYEKPYYIEENFYYPANDCEDRAIMLAFLVRNLLHLDVHLLYYPNHESTAIKFSDQSLKGDGYIYQDGSKYLICDPTYIGARVGQCMPQYENVKPEVELW